MIHVKGRYVVLVESSDTKHSAEANIRVKVWIVNRTIEVVLHEHVPRHQLFHLTFTLADLIEHGLTRPLHDIVLIDPLDHQVLVVDHVGAAAIRLLSVRLG